MNRRAFLLGSAAAISAGAVARTLVMDIDPICGVSVLEPPVVLQGSVTIGELIARGEASRRARMAAITALDDELSQSMVDALWRFHAHAHGLATPMPNWVWLDEGSDIRSLLAHMSTINVVDQPTTQG